MSSNGKSKEESIIAYNHNNCIVPKDATRIDIIDNGIVTHIRDQAFRDCSLLTTVSLVIPEDKSSEESCRSSSSLPSVPTPAPSSIHRFGNWSFYQCSSLQSITIPKSVQIIGESSFSKCHALSKIDIPNTVTYIGWNAFCHCTSLRSIIIPSSVSCLANYTFHKCTSLKSVVIPEESSLMKIGAFAFSQCSSLQSIVLPQSVVQIGRQAFHSCWKLKERRMDHSHDKSHAGDHDDNHDNPINNIDYQPSIETWLKVRYHNLPIHQACYYITHRSIDDPTVSSSSNNDIDNHSSSSAWFEDVIQSNIQTIQTKDAMGMTPLHIYACNPTATYGFMRILLSACPDAIYDKDINGLSPLMLYFICKGILFPREYDYSQKEYGSTGGSDQNDLTNVSNPEDLKISGTDDRAFSSNSNSTNGRRRSVLPLIWDYFEDGLLTCDDLKIIFLFDSFSRKSLHCNSIQGSDRDVNHEWSNILSLSLIEKDVCSRMYPFMSAASISNCGLDVIYLLAMKCPHHLMREEGE